MTDPTVPPLQRLCAEVIALRERNDRQHKLYEQTLGQTRDDLRAVFGQFAADAQRAYQQFRDELTGEKRNALALLSQLVDVATDLDRLAAQRPALDGAPPEVAGWAEGVAVAARKTQAMLAQLGVYRYDAAAGEAYQPARHERVGSAKCEGLAAGRVAQQVEPGYASRQPDFAPRRAKVIVTE